MSVAISLESTGKLGKRKRNITFTVPASLVRGSILEDALEDQGITSDGDEVVFPVPYESGVVMRALQDCDVLQKRLSSPHSSDTRKCILETIYRWRRRMGELIRCCSYLGFADIQALCDESMRERSSIATWRRDMGGLLKMESFVPSDLVEFFVEKLDYDRIHEHQLSQWMNQKVMDQMWDDSIFDTKVFLYRRLRELLKWDGLGVYGNVDSERKVNICYAYYSTQSCVLGRYFFGNCYTKASSRHKLMKVFLDFDVDFVSGLSYFHARDMSRLVYLLQTVSESVQGRLLDNIARSQSLLITRLQSHVLTARYWRDSVNEGTTDAPLREYIVGADAVVEGASVADQVSESTNALITKVAKALGHRDDIFRCVFASSF